MQKPWGATVQESVSEHVRGDLAVNLSALQELQGQTLHWWMEVGGWRGNQNQGIPLGPFQLQLEQASGTVMMCWFKAVALMEMTNGIWSGADPTV